MSEEPRNARARDAALTAELAELDRDATALRSKFLDEFQLRRDSSARHFYESMVPCPKRFRVMTLCKFAPSYRIKPECDEDDFDATIDLRQYLGEHLHSFCSELSEFVNVFIDNLSRIRHDMTWIDGQAGKIFPLLDSEYAPWAQIACDGKPANTNWNAPGWLDKWPETLLPDVALSAARGGRLNAYRTTGVLKVIGNRIKHRLAQEQKSALDSLRIRFAQKKEAARQAVSAEPLVEPQQKPHAAKPLQLAPREQKIWKVIQRGSLGLQYCRELENAGIRPPRTGVWKDCHAGTYPAAYQLGESWRHRIQDEKSKIRRKAKLTKALASE